MFETQEERDNYDRARELRDKVSSWFNQEFNQVQLSVYEKCLGIEGILDYIEPTPIETLANDYFSNLSEKERTELLSEYVEEFGCFDEDGNDITDYNSIAKDDLVQFLIDEKEYDVRESMQESGYDDNFPMWNTIFEFKSRPPQDWLDKAQQVGLGVISRNEYFNDALFCMSAGHSFYSAYWIPLYLSLFESEREKYKNINFSMV